jgi:hypothetical protein
MCKATRIHQDFGCQVGFSQTAPERPISREKLASESPEPRDAGSLGVSEGALETDLATVVHISAGKGVVYQPQKMRRSPIILLFGLCGGFKAFCFFGSCFWLCTSASPPLRSRSRPPPHTQLAHTQLDHTQLVHTQLTHTHTT